MKARDLSGQTFGRLTAVCRTEKKTNNGGAVWLCRCFCGNTCEVLSSLLVRGRKTHCGCMSKPKYHFADVTGQKFARLTALYPTEKRTAKGGVVWHCRCDCGNELDVSYNELAFTKRQSCWCQKREHDEQMPDLISRVAGTSVEHLKSAKIPSDNTTGAKGVYLIRGKYVAKIVFQQKQYHLGTISHIEDAIEARREGEDIFIASTLRHYTAWQKKAGMDAAWAEENPIRIQVEKQGGSYFLRFFPELSF